MSSSSERVEADRPGISPVQGGTLLSPEAILAHPRFAAARDIYIREMLDAHEHQPATNRLLLDGGAAFIFLTVITMQAGYRPELRATWPTMQALKRQMEMHGIASGRRTYEKVRRLADIGYVELSPAPTDRRAMLLTPTETMLAHDQQILIVYYHPLHLMFPDPGYPEPMRRDPGFQRVAREIGFQFIGHSHQFIMANPVAAFFMPRQAGFIILTRLMKLCLEHGEDAAAEVRFVEIGDSFAISRTHVRKLLTEAEEQGFVQLHGNRGALTPACRAGFDRFLADTMAGNDLVYRLARARLAGIAIP